MIEFGVQHIEINHFERKLTLIFSRKNFTGAFLFVKNTHC